MLLFLFRSPARMLLDHRLQLVDPANEVIGRFLVANRAATYVHVNRIRHSLRSCVLYGMRSGRANRAHGVPTTFGDAQRPLENRVPTIFRDGNRLDDLSIAHEFKAFNGRNGCQHAAKRDRVARWRKLNFVAWHRLSGSEFYQRTVRHESAT